MKAMVLQRQRTPLVLTELDAPEPGDEQILIRVGACGVCRTDLHILDGDLRDPELPLIPGHEIVGEVVRAGWRVDRFAEGDRVGVPWLASACGHCAYCRSGQENLCDDPKFTGYGVNGGYADFAVAHANYCYAIPDEFDDIHAAPLLCAGLIGFRSYRMAGAVEKLGLYGFGAAAHIVAQVASSDGVKVYAFTRPGDEEGQTFARQLGAQWAGGSDEHPPDPLDAAILFAPVGSLVPSALVSVRKGGRVVCAGIHMSDIPTFPYEILWGERSVQSVANLTRRDGDEFFSRLRGTPVATEVTAYPLDKANQALSDLRDGSLSGAAVLVP